MARKEFALYGSSEFEFDLKNDETEKEEPCSLTTKDTENKPVVVGKVRLVKR